ncbi:MAG: hypothetical protein ACFBSD_12115 [Paracoccaceae bacterium]
MTVKPSFCLAAVLSTAIAATPPAAPAQPAQSTTDIINFFNQLLTTYVVLAVRTGVNFTYDSLTVDAVANEATITGITVRPDVAWDAEGTCEITIERMATSGSTLLELVNLSSLIEVSGVDVAPSCLEPQVAGTLLSFGYDTIRLETAAIEIEYNVPSSSAELRVDAALADAATVNLVADFEYVWVIGFDPDAPDGFRPVAILDTAEVVIENGGLWDRVSPMLEAQLGDLAAAPEMIGAIMMQGMVQPGSAPSEAEIALVDNVKAEVTRFIEDGDRLVLTVAPEGGVDLAEDGLFQTPTALIAALQPTLSAAPASIRAMVSPSELSAALGGGDGLSDDDRLRIGRALVSGVGAPRAVDAGVELLAPLARDWNAEAALPVAEVLAETGRMDEAYQAALVAMAGGTHGALGLADRLERDLPVARVLELQEDALLNWPGLDGWRAAKTAAQESADIAELRRLAMSAAMGRDMPRIYAEAYFAASLAAAAGDPSAATLRDRLDRRFTDASGTRNEDWTEVSSGAAQSALTAWTEGGLAGRVMERYGLTGNAAE